MKQTRATKTENGNINLYAGESKTLTQWRAREIRRLFEPLQSGDAYSVQG